MMGWFGRQINRVCGRSKAAPEDKGWLRMMYFDTALHYQITARYAVVAGLVPASGNLVHHAIEFYLKGALIEDLDEAARRKMYHNLRRLWRRYKKQRNNLVLDKFDQTIQDIYKFEKIRYPEEILRLGMLAEIGFVRNTPITQGTGLTPPGARYELALDEVDELVKLIFQIENINPKFYTDRLNEHARRYLEHRNQFLI
jgi:HEPN domain-containing protein